MKSKVDAQFKKIVELLKKIHLNVPFTEVLTLIPSYDKLLKEIISNKRKLEDHETMAMTLDNSVVIQNMVIPRRKWKRKFVKNRTKGMNLRIEGRKKKKVVWPGCLERIGSL